MVRARGLGHIFIKGGVLMGPLGGGEVEIAKGRRGKEYPCGEGNRGGLNRKLDLGQIRSKLGGKQKPKSY